MGGTSDFKGCVTHGPWGGSEGEKWVYMPQGSIEKIIVWHGTILDSMEFQTNCSKGEPQSSLFGDKISRPTSKVTTISMDSPNEYLMSISGTVSFMAYGIGEGTGLSYEVKDEVIVGFHGGTDNFYLNAIGVYAIPKSPASPPTFTYEDKIKNEVHLLLCCSKCIMTLPRDAGPWGACGGQPWDDGVFSAIKQVRIHLGELNVIHGLQFMYLKSDGKPVMSRIHGGTDGAEINLVNLDDNGYVSYSSTASSGKGVGFHGRNNGFLSAIGVHMEYF
ncbi:putative jacalin-like lectin domain-containing protein [Helianthus annuus]|nr:putative jacalin-like lectin domain-containing protein [Helianthus annuus]